LRSGPALEFLFAGDCVANIAEVFAVDQAVNVVVRSVGSDGSFTVRADSAMDVVGYTDVEGSRTAGENVDPEVLLAGRHCGRVAGGWVWGKLKSRSPSGMTTREATARATATAELFGDYDKKRKISKRRAGAGLRFCWRRAGAILTRTIFRHKGLSGLKNAFQGSQRCSVWD
jgi:hypothetical protein